ncbi:MULTISPECIES: hypothetical protein [unclassified Streptomyces]|uniref:hypothetical protein n=1 Tax=unclassified Streptomyces TaxID=2593676 RepID=UPI0033AEA7FF
MYDRAVKILARRYQELKRAGAVWRRGHLVIELSPYRSPSMVTILREARPDCPRCQGTGSLYKESGTDWTGDPYFDYGGPCPTCPEYHQYFTVRGPLAEGFRLALLVWPGDWFAEVRARLTSSRRSPRDWRNEPPF